MEFEDQLKLVTKLSMKLEKDFDNLVEVKIKNIENRIMDKVEYNDFKQTIDGIQDFVRNVVNEPSMADGDTIEKVFELKSKPVSVKSTKPEKVDQGVETIEEKVELQNVGVQVSAPKSESEDTEAAAEAKKKSEENRSKFSRESIRSNLSKASFIPENSGRLRDIEKRIKDIEKKQMVQNSEIKGTRIHDLRNKIKVLFDSLESRGSKSDIKKHTSKIGKPLIWVEFDRNFD